MNNTSVSYTTVPHTVHTSPLASITLTDGQQKAYDDFLRFLLDPYDDVFVLAGYSGTGKTTLVRRLMEDLPKFDKTARLLDPQFKGWDIVLTATTNKAAEAFSQITGMFVSTIHSLLGLRVQTNYKTRETSLVLNRGGNVQDGKIIFIDEASYVDHKLLGHIMNLCQRSKIVFMGDPAQLTPVECSDVPVFTKGFKGANLSEVVRQAKGNPIIELSTGCREWVNQGTPYQFTPNGNETVWMDRQAFYAEMQAEFSRPDWRHSDSKFLAWTNKCCIAHNHMINEWVKGRPDLEVGDYAIVNKHLPSNSYSLKTDQMVCITDKYADSELGFPGFCYELDKVREVFMPDDPKDRERAIENAKERDNYSALQLIDESWADLRAAYACTINKAQGSTYKRVFIDLDDVGRCNNTNQIARMLYVGISRASQQVIFTGDLV